MARARSRQTPKKPRVTQAQRAARARRAKIVWGALLGSMTLVAGPLLLLDSQPAPRVDGLSMAPLVASGASDTVDLSAVLRPREPLAKGTWKSIVIHHSGSGVGSPASIAAEHQAAGYRGLGHHFIIGNGNGWDDGGLYIAYRWLDQLPGAHAGGPNGQFHNLHSISICLVGDGNRRTFTRAQLRTLTAVVDALCARLEIPRDRVFLHSDIAPTDDPGRLFPIEAFRGELSAGK